MAFTIIGVCVQSDMYICMGRVYYNNYLPYAASRI